jgi:hypothetical protein
MIYRLLTKEETDRLLAQGCFADDWNNITVKDGFSTKNIRNTRFEGKIKLGVLEGTIKVEESVLKDCGIYNSYVRNCEIGDNICLSDIKYLSNYNIEENVIIENVGSLEVTGESTFGNGTEIEVLNEGGGRELPLFDRLSSQVAYLTVLYRHDSDFINRMLGMIRDYCETRRSKVGLIQAGARICNSNTIKNVSIGSCAVISGASLLEEGTINSCSADPAIIGENVIARKFIILSGSRVDGGALVDKSFIGQGVRMGKQYSAENSLFFANCEAYHGEGCSLFAGPYTVTHHKATLLIASLFSFFNAGSGTNQSNHMYKLGPVHQGILERGSKTGSFTYLLLPCRVGAFTVTIGKHYSNFDTSDFPFSYISEEKGKSELTPAMNMFTVGTLRDSEKWATRDRRNDPDKLDLIHFDLFNPYIIGRINNGIKILDNLIDITDKNHNYINYKGISIHRLLLKTAKKYYELGVKVYIGQELAKRIDGIDSMTTPDNLRKMLMPKQTDGKGKWIEICGLFAPGDKIDDLITEVKSGKIKSIEEISKSLTEIYDNYARYAWVWCADLIQQQTGFSPDNISTGSLISIISDWKTNAIKLNNMIMKDAEKEFDLSSKTGFGIDGDEQTKDLDFKSVRGTYDDNKFITELRNRTKEIEKRAARLVAVLENLT